MSFPALKKRRVVLLKLHIYQKNLVCNYVVGLQLPAHKTNVNIGQENRNGTFTILTGAISIIKYPKCAAIKQQLLICCRRTGSLIIV